MRSWHFLFLFFFSALAHAGPKIITDAQIFEKDNRTKIITLKGEVNVVFKDQHLLCDEARIYEKTKTIVAKGNVILKTPQSTLTGESMEFNYETNRGKVFNGIITSGNVLIESEVIEKIGEEEYLGLNAYYTSCIACRSPWSFTSKKIRAKMGDFAYIHRPWLYVLQFPVLPLPYLAVPLNSRRQTGFLFPKQTSTTGGGLGFEQDYFWAIDRSHDATFSLISYENRGIQGVANYRYVTAKGSQGELSTGFLRDRFQRENFGGKRNRWFVKYDHTYELPERYVQRSEIRMVGDALYTRDFPNQMSYYGQPALDNRNSLTKNFEAAHLSLDSSYYIGLTEKEVRPDNEDSLHRLPEINFSTTHQNIWQGTPLTFQFNSQYLNIGRQGLSYENVERNTGICGDESCIDRNLADGAFNYYDPSTQTGDLIRTGQRLDNIGIFAAPFWVGKVLDVNPEMKLRYTQYSLGVPSDKDQAYDSTPSRAYVQFNIQARTFFSRVFEKRFNPEAPKYKHYLIPSIDYQFIPAYQQSSSRFFGTKESLPVYREKQPLGNSDIDVDNGGRGIQFDFNDRIYGRHLVTYSLLNKLYRKEPSQSSGTYARVFFFDLAQSYDFKEAEKPSGRPWQEIIGTVAASYGGTYITAAAEYYPYHAVTDVVSNLGHQFENNSFVSIGYSLKNFIAEDPSQTNADLRSDSIVMGSGFRSRWIDLSGTLEYSPKGDIVNTQTNEREGQFRRWSLATIIKPPGECWTINGSVSKTLDFEGPPNWSISMEFQFGK